MSCVRVQELRATLDVRKAAGRKAIGKRKRKEQADQQALALVESC